MHQFARIVALIALFSRCAISTSRAESAPPGPPSLGGRSQRISAFTGFQVWGIDDGRTVKKLGLELKALYVLRDRPHRLSTIPYGDSWGVGRADISPTGDAVAYGMFGVGNRDSGQVIVADTAGRIIATFPRAVSFRWNGDGTLLAVGYSHEDVRTGYDDLGERRAQGDSVVIWRRSDRRSRSYRLTPMTMEWGGRDTLYLGYPGRVDALDSRTGKVAPTSHHWAAVSPDAEYSLLRDEVQSSGFRCIEETTGLQVSGCLLQGIGFHVSSTDNYLSEPFWIRTPGAEHLLCVSACQGYWGTAGQTSCRSAILNPRTLEVVQSFSGKVVAQANDGRSLVVLRGDSLSFLDVNPTEKRPKHGPAVSVKVEVQEWGGEPYYPPPPSPPKRTWTYEVSEGDWLPSHTYEGSCDKVFQVKQVLGRDSVLVSVPAKAFTDGRTTAIITRTPITLRTASMDAGYDVSLSVVPRE